MSQEVHWPRQELVVNVTVGKFHSPGSMLPYLARSNVCVVNWDLSNIAFSQEEEKIELVVVSAEDLGFTVPAWRMSINKRAKECGYSLCEPEDAFYLAEVFIRLGLRQLDFSTESFLEKICGQPCFPCIIRSGSQGILMPIPSVSADLWIPESLWVFRRQH